jgi:hypothetical protein
MVITGDRRYAAITAAPSIKGGVVRAVSVECGWSWVGKRGSDKYFQQAQYPIRARFDTGEPPAKEALKISEELLSTSLPVSRPSSPFTPFRTLSGNQVCRCCGVISLQLPLRITERFGALGAA